MNNLKISKLFEVFSVFCRTGQLITFKFVVYFYCAPTGLVTEVVYSVYRLVQAWTVWGSSPGKNEVFPVGPDRLWSPPSLLYKENKSFLRPGADHPPSSSAEVAKGFEFYLRLPFALHKQVGWLYPLSYLLKQNKCGTNYTKHN